MEGARTEAIIKTFSVRLAATLIKYKNRTNMFTSDFLWKFKTICITSFKNYVKS